MRPVYMAVIGDSITLAAADDLNKGGIVGRIADWALTQPNLHLRFIGTNFVTGHASTDPDPQGNEGMGGYEFADMVAALAVRVDRLRNPTFVPMFGPRLTSMYQPLDIVLSLGGANNLNNLGEPTATTHAQDRAFLTALRTYLDARGRTGCTIAVAGGYLDINAPYHTQVVAANATVQTNVYDAIDALNPGRPLWRCANWNLQQGDYDGAGLSGSGFKYNDDIHPNGDGYDAECNGPNGFIAQLSALIFLKANDGDTSNMGAQPVLARNALLDHSNNVQAYSPAATHYRHLYSDAACTVPLTAGNATGYVAKSLANNGTTYTATDAHGVKKTGVAWTFATPGAGVTWPSVRGWKITDNATEGAGLVLAQASHTAIPELSGRRRACDVERRGRNDSDVASRAARSHVRRRREYAARNGAPQPLDARPADRRCYCWGQRRAHASEHMGRRGQRPGGVDYRYHAGPAVDGHLLCDPHGRHGRRHIASFDVPAGFCRRFRRDPGWPIADGA